MTARIDAPERRQCERCGRTERWDEHGDGWCVDEEAVGDVHCIHEWDITGSYQSVRDGDGR